MSTKGQAVRRFIELLTNGGGASFVQKVVLFGSTARGEATEESDVDLLVFVLRKDQRVEERVHEAAFWTNVESSEHVAPIIYPVDCLRHPKKLEPFLKTALSEGKVVYSVDNEGLPPIEINTEEMAREEAEYCLELAKTFLKGASNSLKSKDYRVAVDAGYNAAELCAKGLLLLETGKAPKTHKGIISEFGRLFAKAGKVDLELGRQLSRAFERRNLARYGVSASITRKDAQMALRLARQMVRLLRDSVEKPQRRK